MLADTNEKHLYFKTLHIKLYPLSKPEFRSFSLQKYFKSRDVSMLLSVLGCLMESYESDLTESQFHLLSLNLNENFDASASGDRGFSQSLSSGFSSQPRSDNHTYASYCQLCNGTCRRTWSDTKSNSIRQFSNVSQQFEKGRKEFNASHTAIRSRMFSRSLDSDEFQFTLPPRSLPEMPILSHSKRKVSTLPKAKQKRRYIITSKQQAICGVES